MSRSLHVLQRELFGTEEPHCAIIEDIRVKSHVLNENHRGSVAYTRKKQVPGNADHARDVLQHAGVGDQARQQIIED